MSTTTYLARAGHFAEPLGTGGQVGYAVRRFRPFMLSLTLLAVAAVAKRRHRRAYRGRHVDLGFLDQVDSARIVERCQRERAQRQYGGSL